MLFEECLMLIELNSHCFVSLQILYKNLAHPKLAEFVKTQNWVVESGEYLTFPQSQSALKGGIRHYLDSIEEVSNLN